MNVIFIILDDLGWNDTGIRNNQVQTPNLNLLSKESCELNRNYTFHVCGPTRAMIHTGIYSYKYGMQTLFGPWVSYGLDKNIKILPQYFKEINYNTYAIGKWHLGHNQKEFLPNKRGYDYHYGNLTGCLTHYDHKNCSPLKEARIHDFSENGRAIYPKGHSCDLITEKALQIINENKNNKFFMYLAYNSPHVPLECPEEYKNLYKIKEPKRSYLGMVSHLDHNLGKIFNKLKECEIYDDTIIWIQSDNGGWTLDWTAGDNYPLKGGKASFYEGGVRTFGLIKHKEISTNKFEGFLHSVDILPTLLDFCGYDKTINIDGTSIREQLINNKNIQRDIVLGFYNPNFWCFIFDNIKIIKEKNLISCYDLIKDPFEQKNIFNEIYSSLKDKVENQINICQKQRVFEPSFEISDQDIERCKKLKFWGQQLDLKILNAQNLKQQNEKNNFLELSGYDIFYK